MKWTTKISTTDGEALVRGYPVAELVGKISFTEMIFLLHKGELPTKAERELLDAILVAAADHGIQVPSVAAARIVQSSGNSLNTAVAAGVLAIGDHHGGAIEGAARIFQEKNGEKANEVVKAMLARKERVPGFGHKQYDQDPRVAPLFALAEKNKIAGKHVTFAKQVDKELCSQTGKTLHLNIDGAMAAILSDLGFPWQSARAFFIIARTAGIAAHCVEERMNEPPYRRVEDKDVTYSGHKKRKI